MVDLHADALGFLAGSGENSVRAGEGDDRVTTFASGHSGFGGVVAQNTLSGEDGDDLLDATAEILGQGTQGGNTIEGGAGADTIRGRLTAVELAIGRNEVTAGDGDDDIGVSAEFDGGIGTLENSVDAGAGDDRIVLEGNARGGESGSVDNTASGGLGNDQITSRARAEASGALGDATATNGIAGGDGYDQIDVEASVGGGDESATGPFEALNEVQGDAGNDSITARADVTVFSDGIARNVVDGGDGDDQITGIAESGSAIGASTENALSGGGGADIMLGQTGFVGQGGTPRNEIHGGDGNDQVTAEITSEGVGDASENILFGDGGDDQLESRGGGATRSDLYGGEGNDVLLVVGAPDPIGAAPSRGFMSLLDGGTGNDTLTGGTGGQSGDLLADDAFVLRSGPDLDTVTNFQNDIDLFGLSDGLSFDATAFGADDALISVEASGDSLVIVENTAPDQLDGTDFILV